MDEADHRREPRLAPRGGLDTAGAARALALHGPNELAAAPGAPAWRLLLRQIDNPLILVLLAGAVVSAALGAVADAVAIATIVAINAAIGGIQERRADQAMSAMRSRTARRATVVRDGKVQSIAAAEVVPDDLLVVKAGDVVAADAHVLESHDLAADEALLTGESAGVRKSADPSLAPSSLAERRDHVFMGTTIIRGSGVVEVIRTGMRTEMGRIAGALAAAAPDATPLERRLAVLARTLLWTCVALVAVVAALGLARGASWGEVLVSSVSLAVATVPEGLPTIVTISLALGMQRMARRQVLVRRLPAVETLGSVTTICTDKTGTLTEGRMTVREIAGGEADEILRAAAACCDAMLAAGDTADLGDPTELAILREAARRGIHRPEIEATAPRVAVTPFDSSARYMAIARADGKIYVKGAPEVIAERCAAGRSAEIHALNARLAGRGMRVLAVARGTGGEAQNLDFVGVLGLADRPRAEAREAIATARAAGVRVVMVTGDQLETARAIADDLELIPAGGALEAHVYARVAATDKAALVARLQARGEVVAMTGDGVNDAPAIRRADVGIAMGAGATEVTRESADMVLTDDDLGNIVVAIHEGRGIYQNIRNAVVYLLSGNFAELALVLVASIIGLPIPLLPLHLLWINLLTEPLPAIGLVLEPPSPDLLRDRPRPRGEPLLGRAQWTWILGLAAGQCAVALAVYLWSMRVGSLDYARSMAFSTLVFSDLLRAFASRHPRTGLWRTPLRDNPRFARVIALSFLAQVALFQFEACRRIFHLAVLAPVDLALCFAGGLLAPLGIELAKSVARRKDRRR